MRRSAPPTRPVVLATALLLVLGSCTTPDTLSSDDGRLQVVTTTPIIQDLVRNVGGDRATVASLVPAGADPHSHEPTLRAVRNVVYADVAFSNHLLLEQQSIIRALDANLPSDVPNVAIAEAAVRHGAELIPMVEDVSLDTIWLGMRVRGTGGHLGADRTSDVLLRATALEGPGDVIAYLTGAFGEPAISIDSSDGFDPSDGYRDDTTTLPPAAHTHMSWAFTEPGTYRLTMDARVAVSPAERPVPVGEQTFTFAVGVDPHDVDGMEVQDVLDGGHADVTVDLDAGSLVLFADPHGGGDATQEVFDASTTVVEVPNLARHEVPGDPTFRFLGSAGDTIYQLPQAVLGRHVHGEIDPHLWQDVRNAMAYVEVIRDALVEADPAGAQAYRRNATRYIRELEQLDHEVRDTIAAIPASRRHLVTTHDAFAYLGAAYDVEISGFVTPTPSAEPSLADRRRLGETIRNLDIPAVFLEPSLVSRASTLTEVAEDEGVEVCPIYGDAFDEDVQTYVELMRANARSLHDCLST